MAQSIHPPQEELEYQLQRPKPVPSTPKSRPGDITSKWFFDNVFDQAEEALRIIELGEEDYNDKFGDNYVF